MKFYKPFIMKFLLNKLYSIQLECFNFSCYLTLFRSCTVNTKATFKRCSQVVVIMNLVQIVCYICILVADNIHKCNRRMILSTIRWQLKVLLLWFRHVYYYISNRFSYASPHVKWILNFGTVCVCDKLASVSTKWLYWLKIYMYFHNFHCPFHNGSGAVNYVHSFCCKLKVIYWRIDFYNLVEV